ncbi:ergosterol biosynthetic protein 28 homolog [Lineus longissimus]|uniref:ergosterol biosynthetic protein 28 homolog n=1 Tax=Lineus longissimus TaxID=88925 RepID=UPI002B4DEF83
MSYAYYLRGWVGLVGLMAIGNTIQCFVDPRFVRERLYTASTGRANSLTARLFGMWTLLAAILRICCAIDIHNKSIYNITLISFFLALGHFASEVFIYKTADLTIGIVIPLIVSSFSVLVMVIGYWWTAPSLETNGHKRRGMKREMLFQTDNKSD